MTVLSTVSLFVAQATQTATGAAPTTQGSRPPAFMDVIGSQFFPIFLGIIVLYVFMFRSKRNQDREKKAQLEAMKRGDRVMTAGGILGKIVEVEDGKILIKVDENSNTKIWFTRDAIRRVLTDDKAEAAK